MDYTAIGDTVNLASRLEGANKYYGARILSASRPAPTLANKTLLREIDLMRVKGKDAPVAVYESMGYLTEETFPNLAPAVARYAEGIRHYRAREFKDALQCFKETLVLNPGDKPSRLYVERAEHFIASPPPDDWDGVWTMTSK